MPTLQVYCMSEMQKLCRLPAKFCTSLNSIAFFSAFFEGPCKKVKWDTHYSKGCNARPTLYEHLKDFCPSAN